MFAEMEQVWGGGQGLQFYSRFIEIRRVDRLGELSRVCIDRVSVVEGICPPGLLVFGEVPASGKLGLQSLQGDEGDAKTRDNKTLPAMLGKKRLLIKQERHGAPFTITAKPLIYP